MNTRRIGILVIALIVAVATGSQAVEDGQGTNHVQTLRVYNRILLDGIPIENWEDVAGIALTNDSISTVMIQDGAVTEDKLAASVSGDGLVGGDGTPLAVGEGDGISVTADEVAVDATVVRTSGDQTIAGTKTFSASPIVPEEPTADGHAASKKYVDDKLSSAVADGDEIHETLRWDGSSWTNTAGLKIDGDGNVTAAGTLDVTGKTTVGELDATSNVDVTGTLDVTGQTTVGNLTATGNVILGDAGTDTITFTGTADSDLALGANRITGLAAPVDGTDATHKTYVDNAINGLSWKDSVKAATTESVARDADWRGQTIDTVTLAAGDRVLLKNQATDSQNGIHIVRSDDGHLVRADDMSESEHLAGAAVFVTHGTQNGTAWVCTTPDATLGSGSVAFVQFASPGTYTAGDGLTLTGLEFAVNVADFAGTGLEASGGDLRIHADAAGDGLTGGGGDALAVDTTVVRTTGDQTLEGIKTFTGTIIVPAPTDDTHAATRKYVDDKLSSSVADGDTDHETLRWDGSSWTNTTGLKIDGDGNVTAAGTVDVTGITRLNATTESTDKDTGALVVEGGVGIEKNLNVGGAATITGAVTVNDTTASTNKDTGALVVEGGVGVEGAIHAGGNITAAGTLTVEGNTTLGDAIGTDTVTVDAAATFNGKIIMTPSGVLELTAAGGINTTHLERSYLKVRSNSGDVTITAEPQIADGVAGQMITLQGTDNTNTVRFQNGNGIVMASGIDFTIKEGHLIQFIFDGTNWRETFRTVPAL